MTPTIDFSDVQGLEPIPQGLYPCSIVFAEAGMSQSENPKIDLRWKVEEGEYADRMIFDTLSFHPKALFRTKAVLQALGWAKDFAGDVDVEDLLGASATLSVTIEDSTGTDEFGEPYPPRNRVVKVKPTGQSVKDLLE